MLHQGKSQLFSRSEFLLLCGCLLSASGSAQTSPMISPEPAAAKSAAAELVDQLVENAAFYRATLPSLTAHETIASDASIMFYKPHAEAEANVRMVRNKPGGPLVESRQFTMLNGKPVPATPN